MEPVWMENLKAAVTKFLMTDHDFSVDDAEEAISESRINDPEMWNENASAEDLARYLASDDSEE